MKQKKHPLHEAMEIIPISAPGQVYHHQSGHRALNPAFISILSASKLADLLLQEMWKGQCEIIPHYVFPYESDTQPKPRCVVRYMCKAQNEHQEDTYSYLRYSCGPKQGYFWDIYGDDFVTPELALMALHSAPAPTYSGPIVHSFKL